MPQSHEIDEDDVLVVRDLNVAFSQQRQRVSAVRNLSFSLRRGETLAIVGESGSGKSVTALALMRLLDEAVSEVSSEALLLRRRNRQVIDINAQTAGQMRQVRGADVAMIFQEPMTSLNPANKLPSLFGYIRDCAMTRRCGKRKRCSNGCVFRKRKRCFHVTRISFPAACVSG